MKLTFRELNQKFMEQKDEFFKKEIAENARKFKESTDKKSALNKK